jgi:hypothetical protein
MLRIAATMVWVLAVTSSAALADPSAEVKFSTTDLTFEVFVHEGDTYDVPIMATTSHRMDSVGGPNLPYTTVHLLIPQDQTCTDVQVDWANTEVLESPYYVVPAQPPVQMGEDPPDFVEPDSAVYGSHDPYPEAPARLVRQGYESGYKVVTVAVHPLVYRPADRELTFYGEIHLSLVLEHCLSYALPVLCRSEFAQKQLEDYFSAKVENPEDVEGYFLGGGFGTAPDPKEPGDFVVTELPSVEGLRVEYVIVTSEQLAPFYEDFADWKTKRGVVTAVRTIEWVQAHYSGCDVQERLRNFIKDAYTHWGTIYVLLGGDTKVVPCRYNPRHSGPTDLYYADLEGSWNRNGNSDFGEATIGPERDLEDPTDFLADMWLGRAPAESEGDVLALVNKTLTYSNDPPRGDGTYYLETILMAASGHYGTGTGCICKEQIIRDILTPYWPDFEEYELYGPMVDPNPPIDWEGDDVLNSGNFFDQLQAGYHFVNHYDHSSPYTLGAWVYDHNHPPGHVRVLMKQQVEQLTNGPEYSIVWTAGCSPCAIDHECVGEAFINNPNGGAVAFVGNARPESWGQETQDKAFYNAIFRDGYPTVGQAFREHQDDGGFAQAKNKHLLGDPELRIWTVTDPPDLEVSHAAMTQDGPQWFEVSVTEGGMPCVGAWVCLFKKADNGIEVYARGETEPDGTVLLSINPRSTGTMYVTVTSRNCIPYYGTCGVVVGMYPVVSFEDCDEIDDDENGESYGNDDAVVNPGETIELTLSLHNTGLLTAFDVEAVISEDDDYVEPVQYEGSFGDIEPGGSGTNAEPFVFEVLRDRPAGQQPEIEFEIHITSAALSWDDQFRIMVLADSLVHGGHRVTETEPNSFIMDSLVVTNYGWGAAAGVKATLTSQNPDYEIDDGLSEYGDVTQHGTVVSLDPFTYRQVGPSEEPVFELELSDRYGRTWILEALDLSPPGQPGNTVLKRGGDHQMQIGWDRVADEDLRGYNVYRRREYAGGFELANHLLVDSSATFIDEGLDPYTHYEYQVTAVDISGNEGVPGPVLDVMTTPTYLAGWPSSASSGFEQRSSGVCGDVYGDEALEVVAVMGCSIYVWDATGVVVPGWPKYLGGVPHGCPALGNADGDGYEEIFFGVDGGSWVYGWNGDGTPLLGSWPVHAEEFTGSVAIGDLDQDGAVEVVGVAGRSVYIWNQQGQVQASAPLLGARARPCHIHGSPAIANLDGDLELEVVFLGKNESNEPSVVAVNHDAARLWAFGLDVDGEKWARDLSSPIIADLDGDEALEVVAPVATSHLYVLRASDGQLLDSIHEAGTFGSPAAGDVDGDGNPDVVLIAGDKVKAWRFEASELQAIFVGSGLAGYRAGPTIADIDGDGDPEILTTYLNSGDWNEQIHAFDHEGNLITEDGFPIYGVDQPMQEMTVTDLDLDGDFELIAFSCEGGLVHVWDFPQPYNRRTTEWGTFHGDSRNTGLYAQPMYGSVDHDMFWWGRYKLHGDVAVANGRNLTVDPGTWVQAVAGADNQGGGIDPDRTELRLEGGHFQASGTRGAPTLFESDGTSPGDWTGVRVFNSSAAVCGCTFEEAFVGLEGENCSDLTFSGDTFRWNDTRGITSLSSDNLEVKDCYFYENGEQGILANVLSGGETRIVNSHFLYNERYGIVVGGPQEATIEENYIEYNGGASQYAIACYYLSPQSVLRDNKAYGHGQGGILCQDCSPIIEGSNEILGNTVSGLHCRYYSNPLVSWNQIRGSLYGVLAEFNSYPKLGSDLVATGYNSIEENWEYNVANMNIAGGPVMAKRNWWGSDPPDTTKFYGNVVYIPWLEAPPDGVMGHPVELPVQLGLGPGCPNPFNTTTTIRLANPLCQRVSVGVYDVTGRHVRTLSDGMEPAGYRNLSWNGRDDHGRQVPAGIYFCRLQTEEEDKVSRIVYVRGK